MPTPYIRASELGEFAYCARAWWLRRYEGVEPANVSVLRAGDAWHAGHGRRVWLADGLRGLALALIVLALVLVLFGGPGR